jgi:phosphatidate cytidylyltransferase
VNAKRLILGWGLFFGTVGAICAGGLWWAIFFGTAAFLAGNEYIAMMQTKGMRPSVRIIRFMIIAFFAVAGLPKLFELVPKPSWLTIGPDFSVEHFPLVFTVGVCASFFRLLFRNEEPPATIADIATTVLGFVYLGWMPSYYVLLRNLVPPGVSEPTNALQQSGLAYVTAALFASFAADVYGYYIGKRFGKHPLYPKVSPKKTIEGAVGGYVGSLFWATLVVYVSDNFWFASRPFHGQLYHGLLLGTVVSVGAQLGDLCESLLKRDAGLKDSGHLPGHGGFLDRGDGLIFSGAIAYYWVCLTVLGYL